MKTEVTIYTDGGCDNTTGNGGWAFAVSENHFWSGSQSNTTSNRMELFAIIEAIKTVRERNSRIKINIISDSQYCVKGFNTWMHNWVKKEWSNIKNVDLWKQLYDVRHNVELSWIKAHSGVLLNELVDSLCTDRRNEI